MNTEQQLRQSAEAILKKHIPNGCVNLKKEGGGNGKPQYEYEKQTIVSAMLDFHNQELQRIGEVVYGKRWKLSLSNVGEVKDLGAEASNPD